jgi:RHH-type transcriptional regulator, rel operon repressor / antitoxin RelB
MTETLSIRIDADTKKRLNTLSKSSKRSKSFLAAQAIAAYVLSEEWQIGELRAGIADLELGQEAGSSGPAGTLPILFRTASGAELRRGQHVRLT